MPVKVKVPKLNENTDEVTITGWFRKEGESVRKGDSLVEMTTDKAAFELEAPCSGVVRKIFAKEKSVVPTGFVVALIGAAADSLPDVAAANARLLEKFSAGKAAAAALPPPPARPGAPAPAGSPVRATPAARRLAREKGIDLAKLRDDSRAEIITEEMVRRCII